MHEVAQEAAPGSRVVYADVDEIAVAHSRLILEDNSGHRGDPGRPARAGRRSLAAPETQLLIDFSQPVGLLLVSVCTFLTTTTTLRVVADLRDALAPGSYLVLSHGTGEAKPDVDRWRRPTPCT